VQKPLLSIGAIAKQSLPAGSPRYPQNTEAKSTNRRDKCPASPLKFGNRTSVYFVSIRWVAGQRSGAYVGVGATAQTSTKSAPRKSGESNGAEIQNQSENQLEPKSHARPKAEAGWVESHSDTKNNRAQALMHASWKGFAQVHTETSDYPVHLSDEQAEWLASWSQDRCYFGPTPRKRARSTKRVFM